MLVPLLLLTGCLTAESYLDRSVAITCERTLECNKASFEANWDDEADCRDDLRDALEDYYACLSDYCEFDKEAARECLSWAHEASCEEFATESDDDCAQVFTECEEVAATECLLGEVF